MEVSDTVCQELGLKTESKKESSTDQDDCTMQLQRARFELDGVKWSLKVQAAELEKCQQEIQQLSGQQFTGIESRNDVLFSSAPIPVLLVDSFLQIVEVNSKAIGLLGSDANDLSQSLLPFFLTPGSRQPVSENVARVAQGKRSVTKVELLTNERIVTAELHIQPVRDYRYIGFISQVSVMILNENKALEAQLRNARNFLEHAATHDALTDLPNRRHFYEELDKSMLLARRNATKVAVLSLDLDRFKAVNDTHGHEAGDQLLIETTRRLRQAVPAGNTIARLGGDEFCVILNNIDRYCLIDSTCEAIRQSIRRPYRVCKLEESISVSIGVCVYPVDSVKRKQILKFSDAALYKAKSLGGNITEYFSPALAQTQTRQLCLEKDLRAAIDTRQIDTWFQPIHQINGANIVGVEALARWGHAERGLLSARDFISVAQDCGMINQLGLLMLEQSCQHLADLHASGLKQLRVSVNMLLQQIAQPGIAQEIATVLENYNLSPHCLEIDLKESVLLKATDASINDIKQLGAMGVRLAIDDFGTGYSSLAHLRKLPIQKIKIDRSFVARLPTDSNACSIVKAIVTIAKDLGIEILAEGVETIEQHHFLTALGCDLMQGFLLSKPMPAHKVEPFIRCQPVLNLT